MIATSWLAPDSWKEHQEEAIRKALGADLDWMEYVRLVDRHRTPALSWAALKRVSELEIPQPARRELQRRSDACRMQAVNHSILLAEVLRALNGAEIPAMSLKGPILSFDLYGDVGLRQSKDLDLEVPLESLSQAMSCLAEVGWHPYTDQRTMASRQWKSFLKHEHHIALVNSSGCTLELHWRIRWEILGKPSPRWARSTSSVWQGRTRKAMHPIDLVLYLSSHGTEHYWFRAKWLGDMARIYTDGLIDWSAALDQSRATNQTRTLLVSLQLLKEVYGFALPDLPEKTWQDVPSFLIQTSLIALSSPEEPSPEELPTRPLARLKKQFTLIRYARLATPQTTWRKTFSDLVYLRADRDLIRLPDCLFWAYAFLRPILWVRRAIRRSRFSRRSLAKPAP
jgi:hypothetical protein